MSRKIKILESVFTLLLFSVAFLAIFPATSFAVSNISLTSKPSPAITIRNTKVNVVLHRANALYGLVYGNGFTITSISATGWQIKYNEPTQGQGFYESSGGITPGSSVNIRTYINTNKPNGVYTGSAIVQYYLNGIWQDSPIVSYRITLKN